MIININNHIMRVHLTDVSNKYVIYTHKREPSN